MKHHLDTQSTDLHRIEDIANVLGYKGRVQAKLSNFTPDTEDNTIMTLSNHSITDVVVDDRILIQEGEQQGIYQVKDQAGTLVIEQGDLKLISEDAVVVVKRFDGAGIVIEHIICQLSGGVWNERTLLA